MSLNKRNGSMFPTIPALFDDFFSRELFNWGNNNYSSTSTTVPSVNIRETANSYEVELAAPGMDKNDFAIMLDGNILMITSSKLLDYKLDGDKSREICAKIKEKYPNLPVVAMSCNNNIHEDYNKNGFDDYIPKPFGLDLLYRVIRAHIKSPATL